MGRLLAVMATSTACTPRIRLKKSCRKTMSERTTQSITGPLACTVACHLSLSKFGSYVDIAVRQPSSRTIRVVMIAMARLVKLAVQDLSGKKKLNPRYDDMG